ncbi:unnamed protein product [Bursaphelenchus xylophilus]|uniref:(pine wood nematode) hypothetical protein n=1 Tax=Bursaphelenchus xylophilus TaxID=6326 RepID=A0A1I7SX57_BURXY|nr:unnamed protein product [Bursaphelenchus xylophilus]CAG9100186.1 unnamed protein product [Bursaphelenchus xylophilus]
MMYDAASMKESTSRGNECARHYTPSSSWPHLTSGPPSMTSGMSSEEEEKWAGPETDPLRHCRKHRLPQSQDTDDMLTQGPRLDHSADFNGMPKGRTVKRNGSGVSWQPSSITSEELRLINSSVGAGSMADPAELICLNIGGQSFRCKAVTLKAKCPDARLGLFVGQSHENRLRLCDGFFTATNEYFFERSGKLFESIYTFYVTSELHRPSDICESEFLGELHYWRVPESKVAPCCWPKYDPIEDSIDDLLAHKRSPDETMRQRLDRFCEGDGTLASTLFTFLSICFVLISVLGLVLGSIEDFQNPFEKTANGTFLFTGNVSKANTPPNIIWEPHSAFTIVETTCIIWFSIEYFLRLAVAPNRLTFMCGILNVVDLIAILPFYMELFLKTCGYDVDSLSDIKGAFLVVRIMRVLRVVRILKLSRYSTGMKTFALTLRSSARQLGMMGMVLFTGVIFFSTLLYFVEKDEPGSPFTSIPSAFWWAIVTMSTVGYGDQIPKTILGKTIASGAILSGVLVLALPITIIVDNFMKVSGSMQNRPQVQRPYSDTESSRPTSPANGKLTKDNDSMARLTPSVTGNNVA